MINGVEYCPYCENDVEFEVEESKWIIECPHCGRPLLLCDKCYTMCGDHSGCGKCDLEDLIKIKMKEWEDKQIGKVVYWHDPDNGICSDYCRIVKVEDETITLSHMFYDENSIVEAYQNEIEYLDNVSQNRILKTLHNVHS